jgi:Fe-S-cluster-containing dehydrogenase component
MRYLVPFHKKRVEKKGQRRVGKKLEKVLIFDSNKCTGCRICELTCSMDHFGEFNPRKSYIKIFKNKEMDLNIAALAVKCDVCEECAKWCLPGAIAFTPLEEAYVSLKGKGAGIIPAPLLRV